MIKEIQCVKAGKGIDYGNQELVCIDSWKKVYPDFQICYWNDAVVRELMQDCLYARTMYERGLVVFALDYVKLRILYDRGGLCMDTDVLALNRVPDRYFDRAFIAWASKYESNCTNSGTCIYTEPHNPLIKKFLEHYESLEVPTIESGKFFDNSCIDRVLEKEYGIDFHVKRGRGLEDLEFTDLRIVNRVQFGVEDISLGCITNDCRVQYFLHCHAGSWAAYEKENSILYYTVLNEDTDEGVLYDFVDWFIGFKPNSVLGTNFFFVLFVNTLSGKDKPFATRLLSELPRNNSSIKNWKLIPIGDGLPMEDVCDVIIDFVTKRFSQCKFCRDVTNLRYVDDKQVYTLN